MATSSTLSGLYSDLVRYGQSGEWEKALKTVNKILVEKSDDVKAFHCKVICLIHLSQFSEALAALNKNQKLSSELIYEKSYCLYRLNQIKEALNVLQSVNNPSLKIKELKAQILYRLERYEECFDSYRDLIKNSQDDYEDERETNLSAVICNLHATGSKVGYLEIWTHLRKLLSHQDWVASIMVKDDQLVRDHTYELCYNAACVLLARGLCKEGSEKLMRAEELCTKSAEEDDLPEDDIESELGIIRVQRGYSYQLQNKSDEALKLYNMVVKQKPSDIALMAVASNNIVSINKDQNVFDSKKKMKLASVDGLQHKLTTQQQLQIAINSSLLLMHTNQIEQCKVQLKRLQEKYPNCTEAVLILAALYHREKQTSKAVEALQEYASKHPEFSLNISLTQAQLLLSQGHISQACKMLESLKELSYHPGIVSALVTLYVNLEDKEAASQVFKNAIAWHKKNKPKSKELLTLWRECANFHLRNGHPEKAIESLEELRKINPQDMKVLAQVITAYSQFDPQKAQLISSELPPVSELLFNIDIDSLETTNWIMGTKYVKKTGKTEASPAIGKGSVSSELIVKKKKKKKKGKLPKNYDPSVDPDPERWLPRRERSTYKKRKDKRGAGGVGKGTQGATTAAADIDATKSAPNLLSSPRSNTGGSGGTPTSVPSASPAPQGPRQQRPQPIQKKKKKKGGKW